MQNPRERFILLFKEACRSRLHGPAFASRVYKAYADYVSPAPLTKYDRQYPSMSRRDTIDFKCLPSREQIYSEFSISITEEQDRALQDFANNLIFADAPELVDLSTRLLSAYDRELSYQDSDIVRVLSSFDCPEKHIFMQDTIRGCVEACACMLLSDVKGRPIEQVITNLGHDKSLLLTIRRHNETARVSAIHSLEELRNLLDLGSCTLGVDTVGGHQIVVDAITEEGVHIRDPFHGWAIVISKGAFLRSVDHFSIPAQAIQVIRTH